MKREQLFNQFETRPSAPAFTWRGETLTFGELHSHALTWAGYLQDKGIQPGDRVAVYLPTCFDLVVTLLGNYIAGAIHVPINTRYGPDEIDHILTDSGARVLVSQADAPILKECAAASQVEFWYRGEDLRTIGARVSRDDEDGALMIYTSGTTGKSKGVLLSYRAIVSNIDALTSLWRFSEDDVLALALPLFHVHGLCIGVHGTLLKGTHSVLFDKMRPPAICDAIGDGATIFMGVPTMYSMLVDHVEAHPNAAQACRKARLFTSGSAALSPNLFSRFEAATGHRILERYGMSETLLTLSNPYDGERRPGTVGQPVAGVEARVVSEDGNICGPGEIGGLQVRGNSLLTCYWQQPDKTDEAFDGAWFKTGDVVTLSADGYFSIVGRSSVDIIKSGGYKIGAREIETVLENHPNVREIAVVGVPDDKWGEEICAGVVVAKDCDHAELLSELQELGRAHLADYKTVRGLVVLDELPRNALGKVQKHRLRGLEFTR